MSRTFPALALLMASVLSMEGMAQPSPLPPSPGVAAGVKSPAVEVASPRDSLNSLKRARAGILVFPVQDTTNQMSGLRILLRNDIVELLLRDSAQHGAIFAQPDSLAPGTEFQADSIGRQVGVKSVLWLSLLRDTTPFVLLRAQLRQPVGDSVLGDLVLLLPDTGAKTLLTIPKAVVSGLFPRLVPEIVRHTVSLADSIKTVALLPFVVEGSATLAHSRIFGDSLAMRLQGLDGMRVLSRTKRDSLLGSWDPGACLTGSCRKEVGERLGVDWVIAGRLTQLGEKWTVEADLVRADSSALGRHSIAECQGAPSASLELIEGITARQLAGLEAPRPVLSNAPIARQPAGPTWHRLLALGIAAALGLVGVLLSW